MPFDIFGPVPESGWGCRTGYDRCGMATGDCNIDGTVDEHIQVIILLTILVEDLDHASIRWFFQWDVCCDLHKRRYQAFAACCRIKGEA